MSRKKEDEILGDKERRKMLKHRTVAGALLAVEDAIWHLVMTGESTEIDLDTSQAHYVRLSIGYQPDLKVKRKVEL